ncbi:MAG: DUF3526 domain-containing protein [Pseudomonadota bacterium]
MFGFYFSRERQKLYTQPWRVIALASYALLALWALVDGLSWWESSHEILAGMPAQEAAARESWFDDLRKAESGEEVAPYTARPMGLSMQAILEPGELAALSHQSESMYPHTALLSGWRNEASLFRRYEVQGPSVLRSGRLDLLFVVTVFFPLFVLLLSYDVLSQERESGRLRVFLVQGGSPSLLLLARLLAVCLPLLVCSVICVVIAAVWSGTALPVTAIWLFTMGVYAVFWAAIAALIAVLFQKMSSGALAVLAAWAVFVVFIPSTSQFLAQAIHPVPSRVAYLTQARDAEAAARRNVAQRAEVFMAEHPGLEASPDEAVPGYYRSAYLANIEVNERTKVLIEALEEQQSAQRSFVSVAQLISPPLLVQNVLRNAAGSGPYRAAEFRSQARAHLNLLLEAIGPATVNQQRLSSSQAQAIPLFTFDKPRLRSSLIFELGWVLVSSALCAWFVRMRLSTLN